MKKVKNIEKNFIFDYIHVNVDGDSAIFRLNKYCGQILTNGQIDFVMAAEDINHLVDNLWAVKKHGQWGVVHRNELTKWIIKPRYDYIKDTFDNYFIVKKYHKYGIINTNNEVVLDFIYDDIESVFYDDEYKYRAKMNGRTGIIDINGKIIVPFIYDKINNFYCSDTTEAVLNGKYGMIDKNGKLIEIDKVNLFDMIKYCETEIKKQYNMGQEELNNDINKAENSNLSQKDCIISMFDGKEL